MGLCERIKHALGGESAREKRWAREDKNKKDAIEKIYNALPHDIQQRIKAFK